MYRDPTGHIEACDAQLSAADQAKILYYTEMYYKATNESAKDYWHKKAVVIRQAANSGIDSYVDKYNYEGDHTGATVDEWEKIAKGAIYSEKTESKVAIKTRGITSEENATINQLIRDYTDSNLGERKSTNEVSDSSIKLEQFDELAELSGKYKSSDIATQIAIIKRSDELRDLIKYSDYGEIHDAIENSSVLDYGNVSNVDDVIRARQIAEDKYNYVSAMEKRVFWEDVGFVSSTIFIATKGPAIYRAIDKAITKIYISTSTAIKSWWDKLFNKGAGKVNADGLPINNKITGWTKHGTEQAIGRDAGIGVSNKAIVNAVNKPVQVVSQSGGTVKYIGQDATVVLNQNGKVITTWANGSAGVRGGK
jgi:hypothetical protein